MCLAVPGKIIELSGNRARVELSGNIIEADVTFIESPAVSDWVLVHAGFAIERLAEEDALETLRLFSELWAGETGGGTDDDI